MTAQVGRRGALGAWKGRACLSVGCALYLGPAGDTTAHAHHALQLSVGLDAPFRLRQGAGRWREYRAAIVPADLSHQLDGEWTDLLLLYLEPESAKSQPWMPGPRGGIQPLDAAAASAMRASVRKLVNSSPHEVDIESLFDELLPTVPLASAAREPLDARVAQALGRLRAHRAARRSLGALARETGLSPSRFRHLFRREIGMSAQSYVVWLRIYEACAALARGASLSDAACRAGFSDAAHFTRTFRRTFGLAPSQLASSLTMMPTPANVGNQPAKRARQEGSYGP